MEPVTIILGGMIVAIVSGTVGKSLSGYNKVRERSCTERRESCVLLISEKIDHLTDTVNNLKDVISKTV